MSESNNYDGFIRKSPAALAISIIAAEVLVELIYLVLYVGLLYLENQAIISDTSALRVVLNILNVFTAISVFAVVVAQWAAQGVKLGSKEILYRQGVIKTKLTSYPFANIQRVEVRQGLVGKVLGFGTVTFYMPVLGKDVEFSEIANPNELAENLKSHIDAPENRQFVIKR